MRVLLPALAFLAGIVPAAADDLVSGLSQDQIAISSNYTGTDLVVFGAVQGSRRDAVPAQADVIVVLRGPEVEMTVRKKERIAGLWINRHQDRLYGMPSFYYVASNRPLSDIANRDVLGRYQLGLDKIRPLGASSKSPAEMIAYTAAAVRQEVLNGLYQQAGDGVEFLSPQLFRARIPVPAAVPRGQYTAEVYLFQRGNVVSAQSTPLFVDQTGTARRLFAFAHRSPLLYGLATIAMALSLGWLSTFLFRRR